jgi:hypothetical protein
MHVLNTSPVWSRLDRPPIQEGEIGNEFVRRSEWPGYMMYRGPNAHPFEILRHLERRYRTNGPHTATLPNVDIRNLSLRRCFGQRGHDDHIGHCISAYFREPSVVRRTDVRLCTIGRV